ncbi:unnamed protein product, partial [Ectocarpus sp. 12 AP-2014]
MLHPAAGPHGHGAAAGGYNGLLFEWLISLRFQPEDARGYTTALVRLGFDDLQSLREARKKSRCDATQHDLHRAGMKPGHVKRALKALDARPHHHQPRHVQQPRCGRSPSPSPSCAQQQQPLQLATATAEFNIASSVDTTKFSSSGSGDSDSSSSSNNNIDSHSSTTVNSTVSTNTTTVTTTRNSNAAAAAAAAGGWVVRNSDGSIVLPPGVSCVVCEDGNGQRLRYAVAPPPPDHGSEAITGTAKSVGVAAAAAAAGGVPIRRSTSTTVAGAGEAAIRRSTNSGAPRGRGGRGAGEGTKSLTPPGAADGPALPHRAPFHSGKNKTAVASAERTNTVEDRGEHSASTHAPKHAAVIAMPSYDWRAAAAAEEASRLDGAAHSDGDKASISRRLRGWHRGGGDSGGGGGGSSGYGSRDGRAATFFSAKGEHQSMPVVETLQNKSSARARLLCRGIGGTRGGGSSSSSGGGGGGGGGRADFEAGSSSSSPSTDSGLITEDFSLMGSFTQPSTGDTTPLLPVWDSSSPTASTAVGDANAAADGLPLGYRERDLRNQHQQLDNLPAMRRRPPCADTRVRATGRGRRELPGYKHRNSQQQLQRQQQQLQQQQQQQQAPQYMAVLTSPPRNQRGGGGGVATTGRSKNNPKLVRRAFCSEAVTPGAAAAASSRSPPDCSGSRTSAPLLCRRSRGYTATADEVKNPHSLSSVSGAIVATATGANVVGIAGPARFGPPGRMEVISPVEGGGGGGIDLGAVGDVLGRGGHVKTIRRIRSSGLAMSNSNSSSSKPDSPLLTRTPGDSGGCGGGSDEDDGAANDGPRFALPSTLLVLPAKVAITEAAPEGRTTVKELDGVVDVPEEIVDASCKSWGTSGGGGGGGGGRLLMTLDEDSVTTASAEHRKGGPLGCLGQVHGLNREGWGVSCVISEEILKSGGGGGGGGGAASNDGHDDDDDDGHDDADADGDGGGDDVSFDYLSQLSLDLDNLKEQGFTCSLAPSYDLSEDGGTLRTHGFVLQPDGIKSTPTPNYAGFDTSSRNSISRGCNEERLRCLRPASIHTASGSIARTPRSYDSGFGASCSGANAPLPPPPPLTGTPRRPREKTILLDEIGRGGGGTVHKAIHVPSMRLVAVKMVEVHDDEKRHQILRELKTLLSMKPVPLPSPCVAASDSTSAGTSGLGHHPGLGDWCGGGGADSGTGSSCGSSSQDADSPISGCGPAAKEGGPPPLPRAECFGEGDHSSGSEEQDRTRTTASVSSQGGTLSSRDGTPPFPSQQHQRPLPPQAQQPPPRRRRRRAGGHDGSSSNNPSKSKDLTLPVITFHDAYMDRERGRVCMVMEYMNGGTLQQFVSGGQALSEPALAGVARSVLRGLAEMHAQRKIHRDIKPSNILLDSQGRVKISDFGVVRELNQTGSFGQTFTGTATYMSPERIKDSGHGCPSDIWSLGMVIAALALGHFPLSTGAASTDRMFDLIQAITEDPIPALSPLAFSPELCDFVDLMLRRDPAERPTAPELLKHPFFVENHDQGCHIQSLVDMVKVAPATLPEVQSLLKKVVDYHLAEAVEEKSYNDRDASASFFGKDTLSWGGWSPHQAPLPPSLRKADVEVLAGQLQVTRTELVKEYEKIRKRAERELFGDNPPSSFWRRSGGGGGGGSSGAIAPVTPGFYPHGRGSSGGGGEHTRRPCYFMSSPQCPDLTCSSRRGGSGGGGG